MSVRHCLSLSTTSSLLATHRRGATIISLATAFYFILGLPGQAATALSDQDMAIRAMTHAQKLVNAMEKGDAETAATMTDMNALAAVGGVEGLKDSLRKQMDADVRCSITGVPSLAEDAGSLYAIVTTKTLLKQAGEQATISSYMVGISKDNGRTWRFLNGSDKAKDRLLANVPALAPHLHFPIRVMRLSDSVFTEVAGQWVPDSNTRNVFKGAAK